MCDYMLLAGCCNCHKRDYSQECNMPAGQGMQAVPVAKYVVVPTVDG